MGADKKLPGSARRSGEQTPPPKAHLDVSELLADRPAAPSPFGDDQTFPLPIEDLTYTASVRPA